MGLSSPAFGAVVGILTAGGDLTVGLGHKGLQLLFKQLVGSLGSGGRDGCASLGPLLGGTVEVLALLSGLELPALRPVAGAEIIGPAGILSLGLGLQTLDGQVDLAVFIADDDHLHILALGQVLADIADIGIGYLGNMYHAGLILRQRDKCAEIGDGFYFAL